PEDSVSPAYDRFRRQRVCKSSSGREAVHLQVSEPAVDIGAGFGEYDLPSGEIESELPILDLHRRSDHIIPDTQVERQSIVHLPIVHEEAAVALDADADRHAIRNIRRIGVAEQQVSRADPGPAGRKWLAGKHTVESELPARAAGLVDIKLGEPY